ncbi:unnamed protein product [Prunus armeniaca]|uniref:Uncharacterized protein n=1 Tax=Prunus armeniaca TaxID=36596 RepID=A0A6J5XX20_PRUAR|nr:unnamed protein product [Prunus armeniaca]
MQERGAGAAVGGGLTCHGANTPSDANTSGKKALREGRRRGILNEIAGEGAGDERKQKGSARIRGYDKRSDG